MIRDDCSKDEEPTGDGPGIDELDEDESNGEEPAGDERAGDKPAGDEPNAEESIRVESTGDERAGDEPVDVGSADDDTTIGRSDAFEPAEYATDDGPPDIIPDTDKRGWLSTLLTALDRLERESVVSFSTLDYDVAIQSGLDDLESLERGAERRVDRRVSSPEESRTRRIRRKRDPPAVTTRTYEDELIVTADVSGRNPDDVTVGYDDDELVLGLGGTELERVELPWAERMSTAFVQNGILTVRITPQTDE